VIFPRPEIAGTAEVLAAVGAPGSTGRRVAGPAVARVPAAALNPEITTDLATGEIADKAATDEADRASDDGSCDGPYGRACCPVIRAGALGHKHESDGRNGKSECSHDSPYRLSIRDLSRRLCRIWVVSTQIE
jgi:hypothetical protein